MDKSKLERAKKRFKKLKKEAEEKESPEKLEEIPTGIPDRDLGKNLGCGG